MNIIVSEHIPIHEGTRIRGSILSIREGTRIYVVYAYGHHLENDGYGLLSMSSDTLIKLLPEEKEDLR